MSAFKMFTTRIPSDLLKSIKVYCIENNYSLQKFATEALKNEAKKRGIS